MSSVSSESHLKSRIHQARPTAGGRAVSATPFAVQESSKHAGLLPCFPAPPSPSAQFPWEVGSGWGSILK